MLQLSLQPMLPLHAPSQDSASATAAEPRGLEATLHMTVVAQKQPELREALERICMQFGVDLKKVFALGPTMAVKFSSRDFHRAQHVVSVAGKHGLIDVLEHHDEMPRFKIVKPEAELDGEDAA
jgi:hypothetical protein